MFPSQPGCSEKQTKKSAWLISLSGTKFILDDLKMFSCCLFRFLFFHYAYREKITAMLFLTPTHSAECSVLYMHHQNRKLQVYLNYISAGLISPHA